MIAIHGLNDTKYLMQINEDQLYALLISSLLSNKEWTFKFKSNENSVNKILIEDYLKRFEPSRYNDILIILKKYIPLFVDSRIISTIQNPNNNLDAHSDEIWVTCMSYLTQAGIDLVNAQKMIFNIDYQNIPLYAPKYVHLPNELLRDLGNVVKLKLEDMSISQEEVISIPYNISSYESDMVTTIYSKNMNQKFKQFSLELKTLILQDDTTSQNKYNKELLSTKDFPLFLTTMMIELFNIITLGILFHLENQLCLLGNVDVFRFPITFKGLNFTINDIQDFRLDATNMDVGASTISSLIEEANLFLSNQHTKNKKQKTFRNALIGTTALGIAYMLFANRQKDDDYDDYEDD